MKVMHGALTNRDVRRKLGILENRRNLERITVASPGRICTYSIIFSEIVLLL